MYIYIYGFAYLHTHTHTHTHTYICVVVCCSVVRCGAVCCRVVHIQYVYVRIYTYMYADAHAETCPPVRGRLEYADYFFSGKSWLEWLILPPSKEIWGNGNGNGNSREMANTHLFPDHSLMPFPEWQREWPSLDFPSLLQSFAGLIWFLRKNLKNRKHR